MEPKNMKKQLKIDVEKNEFWIEFSGLFRNFGCVFFACFTFGKEGKLQKNKQKEEKQKEKEQCRKGNTSVQP